MRPRVLAIARTSTDEQARAPFEGLADVELIDVASRNASALIARLGIESLPAWLWPLGEGMIVAAGSPAPLVDRLRCQAARTLEDAPAPLEEDERVSPRLEALVAAALAQRSSQAQQAAERERLNRAEVLTLIDERADELHPATQISRLTRRLNTPGPQTRTRNDDDTQ